MSDKRILWFDSETGGTDDKTDALIQLAAIIEINGQIVDEIDLKMQPLAGKKVNAEAISKHGMTLDIIKGFDSACSSYDNFERFLLKHNPCPVKTNRYIMAGYNPDFDCRFLSRWYSDITCGPYAYWKHLQFSPVDVMPVLRAMRYAGILNLPDTKLETACKHFGIEIQAHDALSDIRATRELTHMVFSKVFSSWKSEPWGFFGNILNESVEVK